MDAIQSLLAGTQRAEVAFDGAAQQIAGADLPTAANASPGSPARPVVPGSVGSHDVDIADQMVTMNIAADMHHVTTAALRSAFSMYRDSLDLIREKSTNNL